MLYKIIFSSTMPNFDPDKKIKAKKRNKNQDRMCYNNRFSIFFPNFFKDKVIAKSNKKKTLKNTVLF